MSVFKQMGHISYGVYGEPHSWTGARFRYTGQIALPEAQLYHYKARVYDPKLGRFLQTDPIGYDDDFNLYAYVGNDPVNKSDPTGWESYMVARRLDSGIGKAGFGHAYIVVDADYPGDPNATVISFGKLANGNMGNVNDSTRASDFSKTTHAADRDHWGSLSDDDASSFAKIDADDSTVAAVADAVMETSDYDIVPGLDMFIGDPAANSSSAAMAVAEKSDLVSGGDGRSARPTKYNLSGASQSGRVAFKVRICSGMGTERNGCRD